MPVSEATYERLALEDPEGRWELACGRPRSKPGMTAEHGRTSRRLIRQLNLQLEEQEYEVAMDNARLRISSGTYYMPDLCVLPREYVDRKVSVATALEVYDEPMPLVVEVWSPSTGDYDVEQKLREYQLRGDAEVWRLHPYERTLTAWRRQPDGSYDETVYRNGSVQLVALPGVTIELGKLFE